MTNLNKKYLTYKTKNMEKCHCQCQFKQVDWWVAWFWRNDMEVGLCFNQQ